MVRPGRRGRGAAIALGTLLAGAAVVTVVVSGTPDAEGAPWHGWGNRAGWYGLKGTVAATPAPTAGSFTLDVPGCSTPWR